MAYLPVGTGETNPDGSSRIGLLRLSSLLANRIDAYGDTDVIRLSDNGSLGLRATEFDWQSVFGVHPKDWTFIIAPDIVNGDVKLTRDGGLTWTTHVQLTSLVTENGDLLMYLGAYNMQVTHIAFDPYRDDRIMVGTRDAGVMMSEDAGVTWSKILGSEQIVYCTGFFFEPDGTVIACSYGRGLWRIGNAIGCVTVAARALRIRPIKRDTWHFEDFPDDVDGLEQPVDTIEGPSGKDDPGIARIVLYTSRPSAGLPVLGSDETITIWAKGLDPAGSVPVLLLNGSPVKPRRIAIKADGTLTTAVRIPDLPKGGHTLELRQDSGGTKRSTVASFVVASVDEDFDKEESTSRFVPQPRDDDDSDEPSDDQRLSDRETE